MKTKMTKKRQKAIINCSKYSRLNGGEPFYNLETINDTLYQVFTTGCCILAFNENEMIDFIPKIEKTFNCKRFIEELDKKHVTKTNIVINVNDVIAAKKSNKKHICSIVANDELIFFDSRLLLDGIVALNMKGDIVVTINRIERGKRNFYGLTITTDTSLFYLLPLNMDDLTVERYNKLYGKILTINKNM